MLASMSSHIIHIYLPSIRLIVWTLHSSWRPDFHIIHVYLSLTKLAEYSHYHCCWATYHIIRIYLPFSRSLSWTVSLPCCWVTWPLEIARRSWPSAPSMSTHVTWWPRWSHKKWTTHRLSFGSLSYVTAGTTRKKTVLLTYVTHNSAILMNILATHPGW